MWAGEGGAGFLQTRKTLPLQLPAGPPGVGSGLFVLRWGSKFMALLSEFSWETPTGWGPLGLPGTTLLESLGSPFPRYTWHSFLSNSAIN